MATKMERVSDSSSTKIATVTMERLMLMIFERVLVLMGAYKGHFIFATAFVSVRYTGQVKVLRTAPRTTPTITAIQVKSK